MKTATTLLVAIAVVAMVGDVHAQARLRERVLERFDTDGDGVLSAAERDAIRQQFDRRRPADTARQPVDKTWTVDGLQREALIFLPDSTDGAPAPVVFGFHGHGGSARNAARSFAFERYWPEAIVVYMQGVPTPGALTDPEGKRNGWQHAAGDHGDRDLKFFDTVLSSLHKEYNIDDSRIYASGHSNGGGFTYLLWSERPDVFAAVAPSAAASRVARSVKPKPAMHIAGRKDTLVRFAWQQRTIEAVRRSNGCDGQPRQWAENCTLYPSSNGTPLVTLIHDGTHKYPSEAPPLIVRFFKEHSRRETAQDR
jgi:polyhydroxybutyrate depolymerase